MKWISVTDQMPPSEVFLLLFDGMHEEEEVPPGHEHLKKTQGEELIPKQTLVGKLSDPVLTKMVAPDAIGDNEQMFKDFKVDDLFYFIGRMEDPQFVDKIVEKYKLPYWETLDIFLPTGRYFITHWMPLPEPPK